MALPRPQADGRVRPVSKREAGPRERTSADRVEELYERARAMSPEAQVSFLAETCRGDSQLERELSSLLAHAEPAEAFFAGLAQGIVSPAVGHRVGHYRLIGVLGTGAWGPSTGRTIPASIAWWP
jgi:hypothetical protein